MAAPTLFWWGATLLKGELNFKAGVEGTMNTYKCASTPVDTSRMEGNVEIREMQGKRCDGDSDINGKFYRHGQWFYQIVTLIPSGNDSADADHFVNSFRLEQ